jgi:hypothetical protein
MACLLDLPHCEKKQTKGEACEKIKFFSNRILRSLDCESLWNVNRSLTLQQKQTKGEACEKVYFKLDCFMTILVAMDIIIFRIKRLPNYSS